MKNIHILLQHTSVSRWVKWVVVLLAARRPNAVVLASFLALNRLINDSVSVASGDVISQDHVDKTSNAASSALLYWATAGQPTVPKDYLSVYLWMTYLKVNSPSTPVFISRWSKYFKVDHYRSHPAVRRAYANKHFVVFPVIFGQILSNYLTPTRYKLNHKYLSSSIKKYILNPIWINYSLGANYHTVNWLGMAKYYLYVNMVISGFVAVTAFKSKLLDVYHDLQRNSLDTITNLKQYVKNYWWYVFHKSNAYTNFIFAPNLLAMVLISLTSPLVRYAHGTQKKTTIKLYTKIVGFVAAFVTIYANSSSLIPDFYYNRKPDEDSPRTISKSFLDGLNMYVFRLIVLSKWRIVKENHPRFTAVGANTWDKLETIAMCAGVWQLMNLNSAIRDRHDAVSDKIRNDGLMKGINRIM